MLRTIRRSGAAALCLALLASLFAVIAGTTPAAAVGGTTTKRVKDDGTVVYRVTTGFDLDQYLYRGSNPLDFDLDIDPYYSSRTDASGFPLSTHPLYNKQVLITVFAFDVDEEQGERDDLYLNGLFVGSLKGVDSQWTVNTFWVPASWVKFGPSGAANAHNDLWVNIDVNNAGWAVEVAWGEVQLDPGPMPVVMAHGLNGSSDGNNDGFNDGWVSAKNRYLEAIPDLSGRIAAPPMTDLKGVQTDMPMLRQAADNLRSATGFPKVNVLAHSFGGLTSRRLAFDGNADLGRVNNLVMIATPNGGSELATDICKSQRADGLGRLSPRRWFDIGSNALFGHAGHCDDEDGKLYQLQQWYVQDVFNEMVRDAGSQYPDRTTTEYHVIAGSKANVSSGILNGQDDGAVTVNSAFYLRPEDADVFGLGGNSDHPGRHEPFTVYNLRHSDLIKDDRPLDDAICLHYLDYSLDACPWFSSSSFAASSTESASMSMAAMSEPSGPAENAPTELVAAPTATVAPGATATIDLATEGYDGASLMLLSDHPLAELAASVDGVALAAEDLDVVEALTGNVGAGGSGVVTVTNNGTAEAQVGVLLYAVPERALKVSLDRTRLTAGSPVTVTVQLVNGQPGETPFASFSPADDATGEAVTDVALTNQGAGVFTGAFTAPASGTYLVDAFLAGPELRTATTTFAVAHDDAKLAGTVATSTLDADGNGLFDELLADLGVNTAAAGAYRAVADVYGANGVKVDSVAGTATLAAGAGTLRLRAQGRQIYNTGADGPYHLKNVVLTRDDDAFTLEDTADDLADATVYSHSAFEHDPVSIDASSIKEIDPLDSDGDGLYDAIQVTASVDVDITSTYQLNARLTTPAGASASEWKTTLSLNAGSNTVTMQFPTTAIGTGSYDTVFEVHDFVAYRYDDTDAFDYLPRAVTTRRYQSDQMEGFPLSPARNARWGEQVSVSTGTGGPATVTTGVSIQPSTTNEDHMDAMWDASLANTENPSNYRVELAADEAFASVVAAHDVAAPATKTTFTAAEGLTPGRTYWFRVIAQSAAHSAHPATSPSLKVTSEQTGPLVAHTPVPTAYNGQAIPIEMTATCRQGHPCAGRLFWRTTPITEDQVSATFGGGFHEVALTPSGAGAVNDQDAVRWTGSIPGWAVTTAGVDYYLEAEDQLAVTRVPGATFVGQNPVPDVSDPGLGYWHVHTVTPPVIAHVPPAFAPSDTKIPLSIDVACATGNCTATMYYRTTDGSAADEEVKLSNGEYIATPNWPKVEMTRQAATTGLGQAGEMMRFSADIPSSFVNTKGVDYFFHVTDGTTQAWSPGSTYEGYYAPTDGMRTGWYHVHVLETPHVVHVPPPTTAYRAGTTITATGNCPALRVCTARLYYRTTTSDVLDTASVFASTPMTVVTTPGAAGLNVATATGVIPGSVADTRGIDYFFSFSDGATTTWWPGTSSVDGYVPVAGTRVGYQHIRVLDPPHVSHTPVGAAPAVRDLPVEASVTCATEQCSVSLHYQKSLWGSVDYPGVVPMTPVGAPVSTPVGLMQTYRGVIPAADVTTAGLAYYIEAFDGYVHGYAPGTSYVGAYLPTEGTRVQPFPVRVLEPAHIVHAPPGAAAVGADLTISATGNCATPSCVAVLHWRIGGALDWTTVTMDAVRTAVVEGGIEGNDAMSYSAVIPGASVTSTGVEHWIEVTDGYVSERTPTWSTSTYSVG